MAIQIGCGSWADAEYVGVLYPKGLPPGKRLSVYAEHFTQVEVNSTYYRTPRAEETAKWVKETPPGFLFDLKLHRVFSQSPEKMAKESKFADLLLQGVAPLIEANRLGAFLLVLAPYFGPEKRRLEELDALAQRLAPHPLAVEFRHNGWVTPQQRDATLAHLRERGIAWVATDMPRVKDTSILPPVDEVTLPSLAYLRLHGRNKLYLEAESAAERHTYAYPPRELKELAARITRLAEKAENVRVVANNHAQDFAPKTALALKALLKA